MSRVWSESQSRAVCLNTERSLFQLIKVLRLGNTIASVSELGWQFKSDRHEFPGRLC